MRHSLKQRWLTWIFLACWLFQVAGQSQLSQQTVDQIEIRHVGPPAVSDERIRANIQTRPGDLITPSKINQDVKNLLQTDYFHNVNVAWEKTEEGIKLIYSVQGRPILSKIEFSGNDRLKTRRLRKTIASKIGAPIDEKQLFTDAQAIQELYEKKGYRETAVKYVPYIDEDQGRGTVAFEIAESPKVRIQAVRFEGAEAFKLRKLRKTIKTRNRWAFSWLTGSGVYKEDQFLEDREKLRDLYYENGYLDFAIRDVRFDYPKPDKMILTLEIFEGRQYRVGDLRIEGNEVFSTEEILFRQTRSGTQSRLSMRPGDVFTPQGFDDNNQAVADLYESAGYLSPQNQGDTRILPVQSANTAEGTMDLNYQIQEGQKNFIDQIDIRGNTKTKDKVIRRELAVAPGDPFNMVRARLSQVRLEGLQYFDAVDLSVEPTDIPNRKNLVVKVAEKAQGTGNFVVGAGFNSVENLVGFIELSQGNFDIAKPPLFQGGGQKLQIRTQIGTRRQDYQLTFIEPWLFDRKLELSTSLFHRELDFLSSIFNETRSGGTVSLRTPLLNDFVIGELGYTLEQVEISNVHPQASPVFEQEAAAGKRLVSKVSPILYYDTRGPGRLPNVGQLTRLRTHIAGGPFGGDTDFYKIDLGTKHYFKGLAEGHILELQAQISVIEEYGDSERVPLFDRSFLGGLYSLRGFRFRDVGPKDISGEPIGGKTSWFASAEYSVPVIERFRLAVFYDIGMVYKDAFSFSTDYLEDYVVYNEPGWEGRPITKHRIFGKTQTYNDNIGIGMRLELPIGPLRLDYGIPLTTDADNDDSGRFNFGVGWERPF